MTPMKSVAAVTVPRTAFLAPSKRSSLFWLLVLEPEGLSVFKGKQTEEQLIIVGNTLKLDDDLFVLISVLPLWPHS